ncbi:hypothetical protein TL16_g05238 [Triparma laevis f. inornata]|uniref:Uncharacterized protein n=2 Tax=Triparma laevis TaxID=1534972 RepID=A0A9W7EL48_9STRA|nr:hypothetical protein TL16_g05238 [Triparma laevis f. inornata]GMH80998.1 hypothetical protein TrLO_g9613 [Triparma laevis f. longispina]
MPNPNPPPPQTKKNSSGAVTCVFFIIKYLLLSAPKSFGLHLMQASLMDYFRPGLWWSKIFGIRNNSYTCTFSVQAASFKEVAEVLKTMEEVRENFKPLTGNDVLAKAEFVVPKNAVKKGGAQFTLWFFTPNKQWLDVMEFVHDTTNSTPTSQVFKVLSFSSGVVPASVPLCLLFSVLFFLIPFSDVGQNYSHVMTVKQQFEKKGLEAVVEKGRKSKTKQVSDTAH